LRWLGKRKNKFVSQHHPVKRHFPFIFFLLFLYGCDPIYHVNYVVENQSQDTILVWNLSEDDTVIQHLICPGKQDTVFKQSGIGYSKPVFDWQKDSLRKDLAFYQFSMVNVDSSRNINLSSSAIFPKWKWNYSESNRCEGKAILVVTAADLKK
jgi:hypothetical protein